MTSGSNEELHLVQPPTGGAAGRIRRSLWILEEIQQSLRLVPDDAERNYGMALLQIMLGKFTDAISSLELAIQANPEHVAAMFLEGGTPAQAG
jgi:tetratricopeptide (TPR) repeat protein